jgi:hypothetical protein
MNLIAFGAEFGCLILQGIHTLVDQCGALGVSFLNVCLPIEARHT